MSRVAFLKWPNSSPQQREVGEDLELSGLFCRRNGPGSPPKRERLTTWQRLIITTVPLRRLRLRTSLMRSMDTASERRPSTSQPTAITAETCSGASFNKASSAKVYYTLPLILLHPKVLSVAYRPLTYSWPPPSTQHYRRRLLSILLYTHFNNYTLSALLRSWPLAWPSSISSA